VLQEVVLRAQLDDEREPLRRVPELPANRRLPGRLRLQRQPGRLPLAAASLRELVAQPAQALVAGGERLLDPVVGEPWR
jgi:hypothetical protein